MGEIGRLPVLKSHVTIKYGYKCTQKRMASVKIAQEYLDWVEQIIKEIENKKDKIT